MISFNKNKKLLSTLSFIASRRLHIYLVFAEANLGKIQKNLVCLICFRNLNEINQKSILVAILSQYFSYIRLISKLNKCSTLTNFISASEPGHTM